MFDGYFRQALALKLSRAVEGDAEAESLKEQLQYRSEEIKNVQQKLGDRDHQGRLSSRVKRAAAGGFLLDPDFLPPLLHVAASPRLLRALRQVLDALQVKADALQGQQRFSEAGSTAPGHTLAHQFGPSSREIRAGAIEREH